MSNHLLHELLKNGKAGTIAVKSLIGHYNPVALELGKYEKHFLKLICVGEKKRNPTLRSRVCY